MSMIDHVAAQRIRELREGQGHSPESLAGAIKEAAQDAPWGHRGAVDATTIRKIEKAGYVPRERVRFVISNYFGLLPHELWVPSQSRHIEREAA